MSTIARAASTVIIRKEFLSVAILGQLCQVLIILKAIEVEDLTGVGESGIVKLVMADFLLRS